MTIEELLTRYGQNCIKNLRNKPLAPAGEKPTEEHDGESSVNGEACPEELAEHRERKNGKPDEEATGISSTSDRADAGGNSSAAKKAEVGRSEETVTSSTGEAGPSCSSTGKPQRTTKSKFFEDSEDESDEAEEEEDSEVGARAQGQLPFLIAGNVSPFCKGHESSSQACHRGGISRLTPASAPPCGNGGECLEGPVEQGCWRHLWPGRCMSTAAATRSPVHMLQREKRPARSSAHLAEVLPSIPRRGLHAVLPNQPVSSELMVSLLSVGVQ